MDFYGTYEHTMDGKGRLVLPSPFRSAFVDGGVASLFDGYVALFVPDEWDRYKRKLEQSKEFTRDQLQLLHAKTMAFQPDGQNRVSLSAPQKVGAGLERDITILGSGRYLSVFDRDTWARKEAALMAPTADGDSLADKFARLDFL